MKSELEIRKRIAYYEDLERRHSDRSMQEDTQRIVDHTLRTSKARANELRWVLGEA